MPNPPPQFERFLRNALSKKGFVVELAQDRSSAEQIHQTTACDMIVLYLDLPDEPVVSLVKSWRQTGMDRPVVALLPFERRSAIPRFFDAGIDDVIPIPCPMDELVARLLACLRRIHHTYSSMVRVEDLEIDLAGHTVNRGGRHIRLTPKEFAVLRLLVSHWGKVVTREMILQQLYPDKNDLSSSNIVEVYISQLRKKIDQDSTCPVLMTQWGKGYLLRKEPLR
jgi:DNA-binding response OmpR family regulator